METISDYFGCLVFDERVMKAKLSSNVYRSLHKTIQRGTKLEVAHRLSPPAKLG